MHIKGEMFRRHPKHQNIGHSDAGMGWRCGDVSSNCRSGIPHPIPSHPICPNPTQTHPHPPICCPVSIHTGTFAQSILSYQLKRHTIKRSGAGAEVIFTWLHKISSEDSIMSYQGIQSPSKCPPTAKASSTSNSYGDRWDRVDQEEVLLNDIEAATKRIFNQVSELQGHSAKKRPCHNYFAVSKHTA